MIRINFFRGERELLPTKKQETKDKMEGVDENMRNLNNRKNQEPS